jgi:hypothetical protein
LREKYHFRREIRKRLREKVREGFEEEKERRSVGEE